MRLLALYTASEPASVAVVDESGASSAALEPGRTVERLVPAALALLRRRGLGARDLDGVAVTGGPGSFTGLRVGAASALGIARGAGSALFAAGTLDVWARAVQDDAAAAGAVDLWVVLDARRGEVYAARYDVEGGGVRRRAGPFALPVAEAARRVGVAGRLVGDGPVLAGRDAPPERPQTPLALALARLVIEDPRSHRVGPAGLRLEYLRQPQAVLRRPPARSPIASDAR